MAPASFAGSSKASWHTEAQRKAQGLAVDQDILVKDLWARWWADTESYLSETCHHPATIAEDGTPGPRLWCDVCGQVLIEPPGWAPAEPPRVDWIRRRPWWANASAGPAETGAPEDGKP